MLSALNIYLSKESNALSNKICAQLNLLYLIDFLITIVDFRSYYNLGLEAGDGYSVSLWSGAIELLLLNIIINETRSAPTKPVVTEDVCIWT